MQFLTNICKQLTGFTPGSTKTSAALACLVLGGTLGGLATPARASDLEYQLGSGLTFAPYGQLHFAYQGFDDGQDVTETLVDVSNANSRVGFYLRWGDQNAAQANALAFQFESGLGFRPSQKTSQTNTPEAWDWKRTDLRKVQLIWTTAYGTFKLGQGSMTTDGIAEADLGGTVVVAKSTIPEANGAYILRTSTGALSSITIGSTFSNLDGGRQGRIRFDTRPVQGLSLGLAYGREVLKSGIDDDYYDLALRFDKDLERIKIKAAAGLSYLVAQGANERALVGSLSVLDKPTGLNLSLAAGREELTGASYGYLKAGWNTRILNAGVTKFTAELFRGRDYVSSGARSTMWGLSLIQELERLNTEVYAGYRAFSYTDLTPVDYLDAGAVQIGARWRF